MTQETTLVSRASTISLREITSKTVRAIAALSVSSEQKDYVSANALSIAEAYFEKGAWFRAAYADETPVGFVMLFDPTLEGAMPIEELDDVNENEIALWRLMIDQRYQRLGFGSRVLDEVIIYVKTRPSIHRLISSYVPGEHTPREFYVRYGFIDTGEFDTDGEETKIFLKL